MRAQIRIIGAAAATLAFVLVPRPAALASTGDLTAQDCIGSTGNNPAGCAATATGLGGASGVALSPGGKSAYVVSQFDNAIQTFRGTPPAC